jgi:hypothetical protein
MKVVVVGVTTLKLNLSGNELGRASFIRPRMDLWEFLESEMPWR